MFKKLALAFLSLIIVTSLATAAGFWSGLPVVGDLLGITCLSFGNAGVCNTFSPIGPANLPATAKFPADTGNVNQPFTVYVPAVLTGAVALDAAPLTGASITVPQGVSQLVVDPAGTIAALTVVLPAAALLVDGQEFKMSTTQTITALTITAGANTTIVSTAITTLGPTTAAVDLIYHAATAKWTSG